MSIKSLARATNLFPLPNTMNGKPNPGSLVNGGGSFNMNRNLGNRRIPIQLPRIKQDVNTWRQWIEEAEKAYWPFRVKMQQGYLDTVLNSHIAACIERRKNLTLLRDYEFRNADGSRNEEWTKYFHRRWFKHNFVNHTLDSIFYGYSLISLGDIGSNKKNPTSMDCHPLNVTVIPRWIVSPDREEVAAFIYSPTGTSFHKGIPDDYHVFVTTISESGVNNCGYGLLYPLAYLEIFMRNNMGFNTDFIEMFAQPLRVLYTDAIEGPEMDRKEESLRNMGSSGYMMLDKVSDELKFLSEGSKGNGYKSYADLRIALEGAATKLTLGHQDAIGNVPGARGNNNNPGARGNTHERDAASPISAALRDIQTKDGQYCLPVYNDMLLPKLRNLGIPIPEGGYIHYLNDAEERAIQDEKNLINQKFATIAMTLAQAGMGVTPECVAKNMVGIETKDLYIMDNPKAGTPTIVKEPKDAIESGDPFKEPEKQRDGKMIS